jgi:hypothetical protein
MGIIHHLVKMKSNPNLPLGWIFSTYPFINRGSIIWCWGQMDLGF